MLADERHIRTLTRTAEVGVRDDPSLPLIVHPALYGPAQDSGAAVRWFQDHEETLQALLPVCGAILLRGFAVPATETFDAIMARHDTDPNNYAGGLAVRGHVGGKVFESSRTPPEQHIILHQEMGYLPKYPRQVAFYSHRPATTGGATTLMDMRRFSGAMPQRLRDSVRERGVLYRRTFRGPGDADPADLRRPWTDVLQAGTRADAERVAEAIGCEIVWSADGGLSLEYRCSGFARHAVTGEDVWFAQVASMHVNRLRLAHNYAPDRIDQLLRQFPVGRPRPVEILYGDGEEIEEDLVLPIYALLNRLSVNVPYEASDILLIDNLYVAHGRQPFVGQRDVQVALVF